MITLSTWDQSAMPDIEKLLEMGLDYYGLRRFEEAVACWKKVLHLDPGNAMALDYLKTAEIEHPTPNSPEPPPVRRTGKIAPFPTPKSAVSKLPSQETGETTEPERDATSEQEEGGAKVDFEALFKKAMNAYVRRDIKQAKTLFDRCLIMRPNDTRVKHNLERLNRSAP